MLPRGSRRPRPWPHRLGQDDGVRPSPADPPVAQHDAAPVASPARPHPGPDPRARDPDRGRPHPARSPPRPDLAHRLPWRRAPAVIGAAAIVLAVRGWSAPVLTVVLVVLVAAALRARSALTAVIVAVAVIGGGALWSAGSPQLQAQVLIAVGVVLIVGAWRHLGAVTTAPECRSERPRRARSPHARPPDPVEPDVRRRAGRLHVGRGPGRRDGIRPAHLTQWGVRRAPCRAPGIPLRVYGRAWHTSTRSSRSARR